MKSLSLFLIGLTVSSYVQAASPNYGNIDPSKARAYQAYVMTFAWPEGTSSEQLKYEPVSSPDNLQRFSPDSNYASKGGSSAFDKFRNAVGSRTRMLSYNSWTLIFPDTGRSITQTFHSNSLQNGYSDFVGSVTFTLGRYLESNLDYRHYRFDQAPSVSQELNSNITNVGSPQPIALGGMNSVNTAYAGGFGSPTKVMSLHFENRTASQKLNYIDHPMIGTLIYFEPLGIEDALSMAAQR